MSVTFTKLFTSITEPTIWQEDDHTRILWITMLAMADRSGRVFASIPGLASRARVPLGSAEKALARFLSPDKYSRTTDNEGRRIEAVDGGWRLLNHAKYRELRDEEAIKASKRKYINERRRQEREAKAMGVESNVDRSRHNAEADSETVSYAEVPERKNEGTLISDRAETAFKAPNIIKELSSNSAFLEVWNNHLENILDSKTSSEATKLARRQMGLCVKWYRASGIEKAIEILEQAVNQSSTFLLDEDHEANTNGDIPF